jgi:hypothetical protein
VREFRGDNSIPETRRGSKDMLEVRKKKPADG